MGSHLSRSLLTWFRDETLANFQVRLVGGALCLQRQSSKVVQFLVICSAVLGLHMSFIDHLCHLWLLCTGSRENRTRDISLHIKAILMR